MAITIIQSTSGTVPEGGGSTSVSFSGWSLAQNDIIVVLMCSDESLSLAEDIVTSGYTQIAASGSTSPGAVFCYKRMGASPDTQVQLDQSANVESCYAIYALRGVDTTTALDAAVQSASGSSGDPDPPSHTTVTAGALRVLAAGLDDDDVAASITVPSGYGNLVAGDSGGGAGSTAALAALIASSPGADNPGTFGGPGDDAWVAYHVSFRPASTGVEVDGDAGSYAVTGTAATVKLGRRIAANAGSYAITGQNASLVHGHPVVAGAGSYAVTGQSAGLLHGREIAAEAGSYAITGQDSNLRETKILEAEAGAYAITGTAAALKVGIRIAAEAGSYAIAGTAATLVKSWRLAAEAGSYLLSGTAAALNKGISLAADAGAYALSGQNAVLKLSRRLAAEAGSYAVTGQDATLAHIITKTILANSGSYAISGQTAQLLTSKRLAAEAGSYSIAGTDADLDITAAPVGTGSDWWIIEQRRRRGS